jgi:hypothetical protein
MHDNITTAINQQGRQASKKHAPHGSDKLIKLCYSEHGKMLIVGIDNKTYTTINKRRSVLQ